jgi:hypothetical protein
MSSELDWIHTSEQWKFLGHVHVVVKRNGTKSYTAKVKLDKVPLVKGTIVGICGSPIRITRFKISAIGVVVKGLKRTSTIKIIESFDADHKVDDLAIEDNYCIAKARERVIEYLKNKEDQ